MTLELVRCGCGLVRNDEDPPAPLLLEWFQRWNERMDPERFEQPRVCRGCGVVYMLPKPTAPSSAPASSPA